MIRRERKSHRSLGGRSRGFKYLKTAEKTSFPPRARLVSSVFPFSLVENLGLSRAGASISYQTGPGLHRLTVKSRALLFSRTALFPNLHRPAIPPLFAV